MTAGISGATHRAPDAVTRGGDVLILAGEASADHHAAKLVAALAEAGVSSFGMGGDRMIASGFDAVAHARDISVMGFWAVLKHLRRILAVERRLQQAVLERRPRVAVLLDLPDFNLRMAKFLKRQGVYVIYYISPQVWAWRAGRVELIRRVVDEMLCVLPFEEEFYRARAVTAHFVGHPLVEDLSRRLPTTLRQDLIGGGPLVALLPGSRRQVTLRLLPLMLDAAERVLSARPDARFAVPLAGTSTRELVAPLLAARPHVAERLTLLDGRSQELLACADAAVIASGTATLEAALVGVPLVAVYKISPLTFAVLRHVVKVSSIILANLILKEQRVVELLQADANPEHIADHVLRFLSDDAARRAAGETRQRLLEALGGKSPTREVTGRVLARLEGPGTC